MTTTRLAIAGMTCAHCVKAVTDELTALDGVSDVKVDLVPAGVSHVQVTSDGPLEDDAVSSAVQEAGYELAN